jgi:RNA polymerase sigma-70 factor (ECF subfamily)
VVPPHAQPAAEPHGTDDVDAFLVREIRRGDQRAWKQLIDRYHGRLAAFARTRIRNAAEVDDVVQDAFVGFLTSLSHFDETRPLETYLFSILRYKIGEALSRGKRTAGVGRGFDDSQDGSDAAIGATHETPSGVAQQHELNRRQEELLASMLRRLVQELRDRDKLDDVQVLELLFFMGLRNKEAADRLGRDEKAIAGVKFRAVQRLQAYLDEIRDTQGGEAALDQSGLSAEATISHVWREHRLTCLKRSTLGAYLLGLLDEPWERFTRFHLEVVDCPMCKANRDDLDAPAPPNTRDSHEKIFQSSVGFLSRTGGGA